MDGTTTYQCTAPPADLAACTSDDGCTTVAIGCYCGAQPLNGVAVAYAPTEQACEAASGDACALGCANEPGLLAQDGNKVDLGGTIAVRCDRQGDVIGTCITYVP